MNSKMYHVAISRKDLLDFIKIYGRMSLIYDSHRGTFENVLAGDQREWICLEPCDNQAPSGECEGHEQ